ncbi:NAD+ synthase [Oceanotoga teriensis]|uniref:NAD+ synthase n=1 Tax=Oceanotoga teriensis TaxID=515440 RepID=UPI0027124F48|nr:NAD+ synthase [Oceanotoga teriensis]MDO7975493.1 NAD+ synthase [Oceanotoga teriensis]
MKLRIAMAQLNQTVGDLEKNTEKILKSIKEAYEKKTDIIVFPELAITGYPPEDLILKTQFLRDIKIKLKEIIEYSKEKNILILVGGVDWDIESYNSAFIIYNGKLEYTYKKMFLPNYSVFDEKRYFSPGYEPLMIDFENIKIGINICEDLWVPNGPSLALAQNGANIIINLSASPFYKNKNKSKVEMLKTRASELSTWIIYTNLVGGQDEVVFDGGSIILNPYGEIKSRGPLFEETILYYDIDPYETTRANLREGKRKHHNSSIADSVKTIKIKHEIKENEKIKNVEYIWENEIHQIYKAIKLGIKDYVQKNGFKDVVFGLSGGMDSAIVAAIACDALGSENVIGIMMPSEFSSIGSIEDSEKLANNLNMKIYNINIKNTYNKMVEEIEEIIGKDFDVTQENLQARIRGNIVMAYSNKFGNLALATSNKSESAVGYSTLYGDMVGGFSPIKDIYKTEIYKLAKFYNELHNKEIIPNEIFIKAPSAELRPDQKDEDSLLPYELLDEILFKYIDREMSVDELIELGYKLEDIKKITRLVDLSEYKRRQAAIGIKLSERAFGRDRRMPITNGYRAWTRIEGE